MNKFLKQILFFVSFFFLTISIISYFGDAGAIFYLKDNYKYVAKNLLNNKFVIIRVNLDERLLQKEIIENESILPETIVLGSSRVMQLSKNIAGGRSLMNNAVSGCSIEDIAAILNLYKTKFNALPKKIILGLDPWTLNINNGQNRYRSIEKNYNSFFSYSDNFTQLKLLKYKLKEIIQLIVPSYFSASIKSILSFRKSISISDSLLEGISSKLPDGSITYDKSYNNPSSQQRERAIRDFINGPIYGIEKFKTINSDKYIELKKVISYLHNRNCDITLILSPYNQTVYKYISNNPKYRNVLESEIIFKNIAKENNIILKGSFNPNMLKIRNEDFLDGMHIRKEVIERIFLK